MFIIYNNKILKLLNIAIISFTIFIISAYSKDKVTNIDISHERIHFLQWLETTIAVLILACFLVYFGLISWWCTSLSVLMFYVLYGLEWLCKVIILYISKTKANANISDVAYYNISAEVEAFTHETDINYKKYRKPFNWLRNLFRLNRYER